MEAIGALFLIQVENHFGIRTGRHLMAAPAQLVTKLHEVEDFPVARNPNRCVLVAHGLCAARHIDNAEAGVTETHGSIRERAQPIRTAMALQGQHPAQRTPVERCVAVRRVIAGNSAHAL